MIEFKKEILDIDAPEIELYRTLKKSKLQRDLGVFIVEGDKVVKRFLDSSLNTVSVLMIQELFDTYKQKLQSKPEPIKVFFADKHLLQTIVGFRYHQGIMAVGKIPSSRTLNDVLTRITKPALIVALDRLESAENTGAIIRNCAASGVQALIVSNTSTDPFLRRSVRNSMGAIFKLPVIYSDNLPATLMELHSIYDFQIIAAHPRSDSTDIFNVNFTKNSCIVLGNEGEGISHEVLQTCPIKTRIPMIPGIDSLNVACASAVILYEAMRQQL